MIYARKCKIREIENDLCTEFLNKYHLQGDVNGQLIMLGIFLKDELLGVMTFGYPRYNNKVDWELLRLCYKDGVEIVGGSEKLFNYFINLKKPRNIISYCNTDIFDGGVYEQLKFKKMTSPKETFKYVKDDKFITESQLLKYGADKLIGVNLGKGVNNEQILFDNGWIKEHYQTNSTYLWDNEINGIIYKITNKVNGKIYIGQTTQTMELRWYGHCSDNEKTPLHNAIKKYGKDNFLVEEIDRGTTYYELNGKEIRYIKEFNSLSHDNGYNVMNGGRRMYVQNLSQETKNKISISRKEYYKTHDHPNLGKSFSEETKNKISLSRKEYYKTHEHHNKGVKVSDEQKQKISTTLSGRNISEEHKNNISKSLKGIKRSEEFKNKLSIAKTKDVSEGLSPNDIENIIDLYQNQNKDIHFIASTYHMDYYRLKKLIKELNINRSQDLSPKYDKSEYDKNFICDDNHYFIAKCKLTGKEFNDYTNKSGALTNHIISNNIVNSIPSLFKRNKYFEKNGKYWYEEYFNIIKKEKVVKPTKKCPYCDWTTIDVENKSGWFEQHMKNEHGVDKIQYLKEHPEDRDYFKLVNKTLERQFETDENKFVTCQICGKKLARIDWKHLQKHGITQSEYKEKYEDKVICNETNDKLIKNAHNMNLVMGEMDGNLKYVSKPEKEINKWLNDNGIETQQTNRSILNGKELDIYIPSKKIAIEFNGNKWHTEWFGGKGKDVHLTKTKLCNNKGVKLIQVFEDEFQNKNLFYSKLSHILGINNNDKIKIGARKCYIKEIILEEANQFLDKYHIQGGNGGNSVYYGGYYNNELVSVMTFKILKKNSREYELTRFATNYNYSIPGIGGKMLNKFIKDYVPILIKSFADRRWTLDKNNNLYTKLGFSFVGVTPPDYRYYNAKIDRYKRCHKFGFRKQILHKKYGLSLDMTEKEMAEKIGYDRIWDCGLFKYELKVKS
jgi:group I intron endonuclease